MNDVNQLIAWVFQAMALGTVAFGVKEMGRLRESVEKLNVTVALMIARVEAHEKRADRQDERSDHHDHRIRELEHDGRHKA